MLALAALLAFEGRPMAATPEAQIKAAYLFKFASFVRWPDPAGTGDFRICVSGRPDVAAVLRQLAADDRIGGRGVVVAQLDAADSDSARSCAILFVGRGRELARALESAAGSAPVLIVTDREGGTQGGAVEFVLRDGRVRFVVHRSAAQGRRLELSSKLLDAALMVQP
jgi:hypothetical protein